MFPLFSDCRILPATINPELLATVPLDIQPDKKTGNLLARVPGEKKPLHVGVTRDGWIVLFRSLRPDKEAAAVLLRSPAGTLRTFWRGKDQPNEIERYMLGEQDKGTLPEISAEDLAKLPRLIAAPGSTGKRSWFVLEPEKKKKSQWFVE